MSKDTTIPASTTDQGAAMAAAVDLASAFIKANPGAMTAEQALSFVSDCFARLSAIQAAPFPSAAPLSESVAPDGSYIVCLEDGARLQMLRRYLRRFNLTPEAYRERWGLPSDYPMTAPGYSARKRDEAMTVGLGTSLNKQGFNRSHLEMPRAA